LQEKGRWHRPIKWGGRNLTLKSNSQPPKRGALDESASNGHAQNEGTPLWYNMKTGQIGEQRNGETAPREPAFQPNKKELPERGTPKREHVRKIGVINLAVHFRRKETAVSKHRSGKT